jgi:ribonuclease Y
MISKGRIIGKEGRNITTFEKETGVSIIIDDTPNTIFISSFDLFRRYVAKKSLEDLLSDKRIQPARIEEIVQNNQKDAEKLLLKLGQQVCSEMGITGFPDEIVSLIGKLRFRTSYGQNILKHSQEVAYIAESIAKQVGADPQIALQGGILHDIGKALDHDIEGTHPEIGGKILRKYGFDERLINLTEAHHGAVPATCIETGIIMIADAISAVRPGARRANVEEYVKRMKDMENLVLSFLVSKKPMLSQLVEKSASLLMLVKHQISKQRSWLVKSQLVSKIISSIQVKWRWWWVVKIAILNTRDSLFFDGYFFDCKYLSQSR